MTCFLSDYQTCQSTNLSVFWSEYILQTWTLIAWLFRHSTLFHFICFGFHYLSYFFFFYTSVKISMQHELLHCLGSKLFLLYQRYTTNLNWQELNWIHWKHKSWWLVWILSNLACVAAPVKFYLFIYLFFEMIDYSQICEPQ